MRRCRAGRQLAIEQESEKKCFACICPARMKPVIDPALHLGCFFMVSAVRSRSGKCSAPEVQKFSSAKSMGSIVEDRVAKSFM